MTIQETLSELVELQRANLIELRIIHMLLEGPAADEQPDPEQVTRTALTAAELVRAGVLRR